MPKGNTCQSRWSWIFPLYLRVLPLCQNFWSKWSTYRGGPLWPVGPVRPKIAVPFSEIFASSPTPARQHSQNDGWFRSKCLWVQFKLQKPDITFLLKQSCTQGSVIAVQPNFFFCFWFSSAFKDNTLLASPYVDDVFVLFFFLAVCDPSPYSFWLSVRKNPQLIPTTSASSTKALERWEDKHVQATWSSSRNLGSLTLPNNQFGWTFGSDAFHFPLVSTSGLGPVCQYNGKDPSFSSLCKC